VINHCDRHITLLSDTDLLICLIYLLILICLLGDSNQGRIQDLGLGGGGGGGGGGA
jgi:hypothetical protein